MSLAKAKPSHLDKDFASQIQNQMVENKSKNTSSKKFPWIFTHTTQGITPESTNPNASTTRMITKPKGNEEFQSQLAQSIQLRYLPPKSPLLTIT